MSYLNSFTFKIGREIQMKKDLWIPQSKIMQCLQDGVHFIIPFNDTAGKKSKQYLVTLWPMINNVIQKFVRLFQETKCKILKIFFNNKVQLNIFFYQFGNLVWLNRWTWFFEKSTMQVIVTCKPYKIFSPTRCGALAHIPI